jgi:hypothetical protein
VQPENLDCSLAPEDCIVVSNDWSKLHIPGKNSLVTIVASLQAWRRYMKQGEKARLGWLEAVTDADVDWMIRSL